MTQWITRTLDFKATGSLFSPVPLGHYWTKESLLSTKTVMKCGQPEQRDYSGSRPDRVTARGLLTLYNLHFWMIYFRISYLLHLNHGSMKVKKARPQGKRTQRMIHPSATALWKVTWWELYNSEHIQPLFT